MQYFKHMTSMRNDAKIKRLIAKYGLEGYGLYNLILESIAATISTESPVPDLEETCEDIAEFYNGNTAKINEMVFFMVNQGLLEVDEFTERIACHKIYKFLEQSQTRSPAIRNMIQEYKKTAPKQLIDVSETVSDICDRKEKNRTEKNKTETPPIVRTGYGENKRVLLTDEQYNKLIDKLGKSKLTFLIDRMDGYLVAKGTSYKNYYQAIINWSKQDYNNNNAGRTDNVKVGVSFMEEMRRNMQDDK